MPCVIGGILLQLGNMSALSSLLFFLRNLLAISGCKTRQEMSLIKHRTILWLSNILLSKLGIYSRSVCGQLEIDESDAGGVW